MKEELENCTFKPELCPDRLRSASRAKRSNSVNGFEKTVHRLKVGIQKTRIEKERKELERLGASKEAIDKFLETANKTWNRFDSNNKNK